MSGHEDPTYDIGHQPVRPQRSHLTVFGTQNTLHNVRAHLINDYIIYVRHYSLS